MGRVIQRAWQRRDPTYVISIDRLGTHQTQACWDKPGTYREEAILVVLLRHVSTVYANLSCQIA